MKANIKRRVVQLMADLPGEPSVRSFCLVNDINYVSLFNCFHSDQMGMKMVNAFKKAVPNLNMNWFLYGEGTVFLSHKLPIDFVTN